MEKYSCFLNEDLPKTLSFLNNKGYNDCTHAFFYSKCSNDFIKKVIHLYLETCDTDKSCEIKFIDDFLENGIKSLCLIEHHRKDEFIDMFLSDFIPNYFKLLNNLDNDKLLDVVGFFVDIVFENINNELFIKMFFSKIMEINFIPKTFLDNSECLRTISKINKNLLLFLVNKHNLSISLNSIIKSDIFELLDESTFEEDIDTLLLLFKENKSFYCIYKFLEKELLNEEQKKDIISYIKNFRKTQIDSINYKFLYNNIQVFIKLIKILNIDISDCLDNDIILNIFNSLKINEEYIPLELIKTTKLNWIVYENIEFNDIPDNLKPDWKYHWFNKIRNEFSKEQIIYFYDELFENDNMKEVYLQIQDSVDYAPHSLKYYNIKNDFYKKINT